MQRKLILSMERLFFAARWLLVVPYSGLVAVLFVYTWRFLIELMQFLSHALSGKEELLVETFHVLENLMVCNFLVILLLGGYATFIHPNNRWDLPWLNTMSTFKLEVKTLLAIVSYTSVKLLEDAVLNKDPFVRIAILLTFIGSCTAVALISNLLQKAHDTAGKDH